MKLTKKQTAVLAFIIFYRSEHRGQMPTTRELQKHFGWKSQTSAVGYIRKLENAGRIRRQAYERRGIELV